MSTPVTLAASVGTASTSVQLTAQPPSWNQLYVGVQPASVTGGNPIDTFTLATTVVAANTPVTITATWNVTSARADLTVARSPVPVSLTISPSVTFGFDSVVSGTVTLATAPTVDANLQVTSDDPSFMIFLTTAVTIPAGSKTGTFQIPTSAVTTQTAVRISVSGGGSTVSATLTAG